MLSLYLNFGGSGGMQMPYTIMNIINGGAHANNNLDMQEFMIVPLQADTFSTALRMGTEAVHALRDILQERGMSTAVGEEGGYEPSVQNHEEDINVHLQALDEAQ